MKLRNQMNWIKCSERMPEKDTPVLAFDGKRFHIGILGEWAGKLEINHYDCGYGCHVDSNETTHWAELEVPK